jgi:hypothetical protein
MAGQVCVFEAAFRAGNAQPERLAESRINQNDTRFTGFQS